MSATDSTKQLSPKVKWAGLVGAFITALSAAGAALTPELFEGLGAWGFVVYIFVTALFISVAAWWKADPLRENYTAQVNAMELQHQREENPTQNRADSLPPEDWARDQWPDNRG